MSSAALTPRVDKPRVDEPRVDKARVEHDADSAVTSGGDFHGRTKVSAKAIARIVAAIAGESFGVPARTVGVQLDDSSGMLAVTATTGISVPSLVTTRVPSAPSTVLDRASAAQSAIRTRTGELTGSQIGPVTVRLNAANIEEEERTR
ncbi:hypothetical protein BH09ACT6_BH09ACT6_13220 [soil metagenome]